MPNRNKPPFRAEHVGSLLRPKAVLEARDKFERNEIAAGQLREVEDKAIRAAVKRQENIGLAAVTDGEFRRGSWHMDFLCRIGGVVPGGTQLRPFHNETGDVRNEILLPKVIGRLHLEKPIFGEDFLFLKSITSSVPKLTIPAPSLLHGLGATLDNGSVYADEQSLLDDLVKVYAEQMRLLEAIGCTYLQIDDTMFATLGDPNYRDKIRTPAGNPDQRHLIYIDLINRAIAKRSANLDRVRPHLPGQSSFSVGGVGRLRFCCRGHFRQTRRRWPLPRIRRCQIRHFRTVALRPQAQAGHSRLGD
jgi:5-methyltetrahydropteroyltriglutamate--homocysteine methyltransferase